MALVSLFVLSGCTGLPKPVERLPEQGISCDEARNTSIARSLRPLLDSRKPGLSGIYPLVEADDAFAARMLMARHAERSLDVQYYIWRPDMTGLMLLEALHEAADRGVRVRLLLDDNNTAGIEPFLLAMHAHPNIEVRLFNPFVIRRGRWLNFVTDFARVNRRMHNKSFTVDGSATIVGGRNIGDKYFGAADDFLFADLDVLAVGAVVPKVSQDFDRYWNSPAAYRLSDILARRHSGVSLARLAEQAEQISRNPAAEEYLESLREADLLARLMAGELEFEWAPVRMVSDAPGKVWQKHRKDSLLVRQLQEIIGNPRQDVELVSPYFVLTAAGVDAFAWLVQNGVEVRVLTNSLAATDVAFVHAGYARRRKALLRAGVQLYELSHVRSVQAAQAGRRKRGRLLGSSGSSLHAKTFSVDGQYVFVGSFNFDPRSANLNTELGFVIDSPGLALSIRRAFDEEIPDQAYRLSLDDKGRLRWTVRDEGRLRVYHSEPKSGLLRRAGVRFLSWLPIESLL